MIYNDEGDLPYVAEDDPDKDKVSIATEVVDGLSVAPTEMLANEYQRLMD